jgi:hydroxymethylpyrimidine pyrophosphatase-like HAD family hydrolase
LAVGNDYNDLELLDWADHAFVVANAPAELCARYALVASNDEAGFSEAVRIALERL